MTRKDALRVLAGHSRAKYSRVQVPIAIRDALEHTRGDYAERERVYEAIGVICGAPMGLFVHVQR